MLGALCSHLHRYALKTDLGKNKPLCSNRLSNEIWLALYTWQQAIEYPIQSASKLA